MGDGIRDNSNLGNGPPRLPKYVATHEGNVSLITFALNNDVTTIGRNHLSHATGQRWVNDINLPYPYVSKNHCKILRSPVDGNLTLEDLGSKGGTWLNGVPIQEVKRLTGGDEILVGGIKLHIIEQ